MRHGNYEGRQFNDIVRVSCCRLPRATYSANAAIFIARLTHVSYAAYGRCVIYHGFGMGDMMMPRSRALLARQVARMRAMGRHVAEAVDANARRYLRRYNDATTRLLANST